MLILPPILKLLLFLPAGLEGEKAGTLKFVEDEESSTHDIKSKCCVLHKFDLLFF